MRRSYHWRTGDSGDTQPYAVAREVEDLAGLVEQGRRGDAVERFMVAAAAALGPELLEFFVTG